MKVLFAGSGDAFGTGGRFNTCFYVRCRAVNFLVDCGASSLIALKQNAIDLNSIAHIFITHFHADHFGGIPYFLLDAQFFSKRATPLTIIGPVGILSHYCGLADAMFPGSARTQRRFPLRFAEIRGGERKTFETITVKAFDVNHGASGGPFLGYRLEVDGKTLAYTGDAEWADDLVGHLSGADLLIAEAYFYDRKVKLHLDFATFAENVDQLNSKKVILTHMGPDMIDRVVNTPFSQASDGLWVDV